MRSFFALLLSALAVACGGSTAANKTPATDGGPAEMLGTCSMQAEQAVLTMDPAQDRQVSVTYYAVSQLPPAGQAKYPQGDYCVDMFAPPGVAAPSETYVVTTGDGCSINSVMSAACGN
jgi:hypothetical protein